MPTIDQITAYIESLSQDDRPSVVLPKEPARIAILEVLQNKAILLTRQSNWTTLLSNLLEHHDEDPRFQEARRMVLRILIGPDLSKRLVYFIKYLVLGPEKFAIYKDQEVDTIKGALGAVTDFLAYIATGNADYWRSFVMRLWRGRTDVPMSDVDRHNLSLYFASHLEILVPDNVYGCAKGILLPIWQLFLEPKNEGFDQIMDIVDGSLGETDLVPFLRLFNLYLLRRKANGESNPDLALFMEATGEIDYNKILFLVKCLAELNGHIIRVPVSTESTILLMI